MIELSKLRKSARNLLRFRLIEPIRYAVDVAKAAMEAERHAPLKILLVDDQTTYTSEQQFAPLLADRDRFRRRLRVVFNYQLLSDVLLMPRRVMQRYDVVGLKLGFRTPLAEVLRVTQTIKSALASDAKLVYFDGDDDLCVQWPKLLPLVDLYVKKHCFRDRSEYRKPRIGKSNLSDYLARNFGIDFADDFIPATEPVDEEQLGKIFLGWNVGLDEKIRRLHAAHRILPTASTKDIDVVCRATVNQESSIYRLRSEVIPKINFLGNAYRVLTPEKRVPQEVYYEEMLRSRLCVSPFGYGEICWRDFEAILCGCVLVKPDVSHLESVPDIFIPYETYVPVQWDYSDLESKISQLLAQPEQCERIRARAFSVLNDYLEGDGVIECFRGILKKLDFAGAAVPSAGR